MIAIPSNTNAYTNTQAYFHAMLYRRAIQECIASDPKPDAFLQLVEQCVHNEFPLVWPAFAAKCFEAGWDLSKTELHTKGYEISIQ